MKTQNQFVVVYDNGSGYEEYCSKPQPTVEAASTAAKGVVYGGYKRIKVVKL